MNPKQSWRGLDLGRPIRGPGRTILLRWKLGLIRALILLGFAGVIQILCIAGIIDTLTMQPPHRIATDLVRLLGSGEFNRAIVRTLSNAMIATVMAMAVGVTVATLIHRVRGLREALDLLFSTWYAVPILAFYPLLIVIFGLTSLPSIVIGFMQGVVAVIVSTLDGLDRVPQVLRKLARTQHMSALETAWLITLPAAAPWLLSGAKLAIAFAIIGVVASEFLMAREGMGFEISYAYNNFDNARMYPLIVLVIVFSVSVNAALLRWEAKLARRRGLKP
jgi:NitT/TauT family transport system permease protein